MADKKDKFTAEPEEVVVDEPVEITEEVIEPTPEPEPVKVEIPAPAPIKVAEPLLSKQILSKSPSILKKFGYSLVLKVLENKPYTYEEATRLLTKAQKEETK